MKKIILFLTALNVLMFSGCKSDDAELVRPGGNNTVTNGFNLSFDVINSLAQTRGNVPSFPGDDYVNTMHVFFFEYYKNGTGKFVDAIYMEGDFENPLGTLGAIEIEFPDGSNLDNNTDYSILVCANFIPRFTGMTNEELLGYFTGLTENEAVWKLKLVIEGADKNSSEYELDNSNKIAINYLPMSGRTVKQGGEEVTHVDLTRCVARFDVINEDEVYTLVSASIWNAYPYACPWESVFMDFSEDRIERFYGVNGLADNNSTEGELYVFENYEITPNEIDKNTTCLILGMAKGGNTFYYRVNVNARSIGQYIKRNNVYTTTVRKVLGEGARTEFEAYDDSRFLLDVDVNGWNVIDHGNIQYDGENIFAIPTKTINFGYDGGTVEYEIYTYGKYELEISDETVLPTGVTVTLINNIITVTAGLNYENTTGNIVLKFGTIENNIIVNQNGSAKDVIDLSVTALDPFLPVGDTEKGPVIVSSSGAWTAKLYDSDNCFSFEGGRVQSETNGVNGTGFSIYPIKDNDTPVQHHAFVVVSLTSAPNINRTLVLTQSAGGGILLSPTSEIPLYFTVSGYTIPSSFGNAYWYDVITYDGEGAVPWKAYEVYGEGNFLIHQDTDADQLWIKAKDTNIESTPLETLIRVEIDDPGNPYHGTYVDVKVIQEAHTLFVTPATHDDIPATGGSTVPIQISSTSNWTATITSTGNDATFGNGETTISGAYNGMFTVNFPHQRVPDLKSIAEITVKLDDTNIEKKIIVAQEPLLGRSLNFRSISTTYLSVAAYTNSGCVNHVYQMASNMRNLSIVGPIGSVFMPYGYSFSVSSLPDDNTDIFQVNCTNPGSSDGPRIRNWLAASDKRILFLCPETSFSATMSSLGLSGTGGYVGGDDNDIAITDIRNRLHPNVNTKLMQFLLKDGPFTKNGEIPADGLGTMAHDGVNVYITSWPDTFIPIMMDPRENYKDRCIFGIDPTNRIIFCGDAEIFGNREGGSAEIGYNYVHGPSAVNNMKFLNNVIAWMTYAAQHGDIFLDQFKVTP